MNSTATAVKAALDNLPHDWRQLRTLGLEFRGRCPECDDPVCRSSYPEWKASCCGKTVSLNPTEDVSAAYDAWAADVQVGYERALSAFERSVTAGAGDWGSFEMFQLAPNDPLRNEVNSMAEYRAACKARFIDPDTHKPTDDNPKHGRKESHDWA